LYSDSSKKGTAKGIATVAIRPRFGCYEPVSSRFSCAEVAEGSAGQAPGGKVARWRGVKVERTYTDVLSSPGRQIIRQLLPIILCTPVCCAITKDSRPSPPSLGTT